MNEERSVIYQPDKFNWLEIPVSFKKIIELNIFDFEPWYILQGDMLADEVAGLVERYPDRELYPFAKRDDNDDVACWQNGFGRRVLIIHDYAKPGWELKREFPSFIEWFEAALSEMIEFLKEEENFSQKGDGE
ncbi:hypothetical protein [Rhizobium paknamense]|uniref:SMI1/KNR4 family protein n=1 Tax=Rhizobium paknamense TaxID=1206817 RepID=A0ABU0IJK8_9HYPH|nr:hypothetical protein [Rhizobium paknamense]MDQ0458445.1 hypothetical protein [Rhizobium paknamense]